MTTIATASAVQRGFIRMGKGELGHGISLHATGVRYIDGHPHKHVMLQTHDMSFFNPKRVYTGRLEAVCPRTRDQR